jgi:hypothetical protein
MLRFLLGAIRITAVLPATSRPSAGRFFGTMDYRGRPRRRVEYTFFTRYDLQPPLTFTYPLDGSVG